MSSASSALFTPTTTYTNLFPSSTQSSSNNDGTRNTNVYYLVFLGVLVILLLLAACLAFRAFRIRRRYRTATQLAIARGAPLPADPHAEFWGLTPVQAWPERDTRKKKAQKIPVLWENEVAEGDWIEQMPIMLVSKRPEPEEVTAQIEPDSPRRSFRPFSRRRRAAQVEESLASPEGHLERERTVEEGEKISLAVVIQMPTNLERRRQSVSDDSEAEEEPGWTPGMEFGVWDGRVGRS